MTEKQYPSRFVDGKGTMYIYYEKGTDGGCKNQDVKCDECASWSDYFLECMNRECWDD